MLLSTTQSFVKKYLDKQYIFRYLIVLNLFFISFLIIICLGSTLTADDYQFFDFTNTQSYSYVLSHYGSEISGRYSFAFVVITSIKLFGLKALSILPIASLLLLIIGAIYASINFLKIIKKASAFNAKLAAAIATFAVIASLITAPSIFDTFVWFSAVPVYILSFAVLFIAISIALKDLLVAKTNKLYYSLVFLICLFAAGFIEVIPVELTLLGATGWLTTLYIKVISHKQKVKLLIYSIVFLASGIIGGAILRFSPWTSLRLTSGRHFSTEQIISITFGHLQLIPNYIFSWRILFSVGIGILILLCVGKVNSKRNRILVFILSLCLIIVPCLIIGALASSAGLIEATNLGSNRLLYDGTSGIMLGIALVIYLFGSSIHLITRLKLRAFGSFSLIIILFLCFVVGGSSLNKVAQAVYVKKSMVEYREAVIKNDLTSNRSAVRIVSASILLKDSQVNDIGFGSPKVQIWENYLRTYYNIPQTKKLQFSSEAPAGYCTLTSDSVTYGKQTCSEIVNSADVLKYTTYP